MKDWIVPFAEARLFFRAELAKFVESIQRNDVFLTHMYWPTIRPGQILIHEMQMPLYPERDGNVSTPAVSGHRVYVTFGGAPEQFGRGAELIAKRIDEHIRTYSDKFTVFEDFTMQVRSFDTLSQNIVPFGTSFCIDGYHATLCLRT